MCNKSLTCKHAQRQAVTDCAGEDEGILAQGNCLVGTECSRLETGSFTSKQIGETAAENQVALCGHYVYM